jgi:hypothetical protein
MDSMKSEPQRDQKVVIEPEEYEALMAELPTPEENPDPPELEERMRKIEYCMIIVITLILVIFFFYRN